MIAALRHRGPDDGDLYIDGPVALGHRRLSIIDLHPRGRQPMSDGDGLVITYNGELYNYRQLRKVLQDAGVTFNTETDTEVVLRSYKYWGRDFLRRMIGMFALGLWDSDRGTLLLARDPLGIKPLHYHIDSDRLVFASEQRALVRSGAIAPRLDDAGFLDMLTFGADIDPRCALEGVVSLRPGHALEIGRTEPREWRYWSPRPEAQTVPEDEAIERLRETVAGAVRNNLASDVPVGVFLSAGVDSNVVAHCVSQASEPPVNAYIMSFPEANFDEAEEATASARQMGLVPIVERLPEDEMPDLIERVMSHSGEITPNPSFIATWHLAQAAARDVKVVLSGDGPDELLAGYPTYIATLASRPAKRLIPDGVVNRAATWLDGLPSGFRKNDWRERLQRFAYGLKRAGTDRHGIWRVIARREQLAALLQPDLMERLSGLPDPVAESYGSALDELPEEAGLLRRLCAADTAVYLPNDGLVKMDRVGMAHGLEIRVPFLNHDVVDLCLNLPNSARFKCRMDPWPRLEQKSGLKRAFAQELSPQVLRGAKRGFNAPAGRWINGAAKQLVSDMLSEPELRRQGIFRPETVAALLRDHRQCRTDHSNVLWTILATTIWARTYGVSV